jgi:N-acetylglucosaminyl-diphospho-decaprenol L-rhamnosyltransferase
VDLAVIVVSANDARWLEGCLSSVFAHAGPLELEVFVVDNACTDGTRELVHTRFPRVRTIDSPNLGFAHGNNRALERTGARYALLLNPDTIILRGTLAELIDALDAQPRVGVAGVRQVDPDGALLPTIRRFPHAARALGEALGSERWPLRPAWAGERVLDPVAYEREGDCDWVVGSFLLARREALLAAGLLDERFFLYCEEPDLCLRVARAGWRVRHMPQLTIRHHAGKGGVRPRMLAQETFARRQYARKHFAPLHRALYVGALGARHALRAALPPGSRAEAPVQRAAAVRALRSLGPRSHPPFIAPPPTAVGPPPPGIAADSPPSGIDAVAPPLGIAAGAPPPGYRTPAHKSTPAPSVPLAQARSDPPE